MFVPLEQHSSASSDGVLVFRVAQNPASLVADVRRVVGELNPQVALARVETMLQVVDGSLAQPIRLRFFLTLFAAPALVLGAVGVYGVVSYAVDRRRSEFGVRLARGASPQRVQRDVLWGGLVPVLFGIGVGLVMAAVLGQALNRFLYGVSPSDPASFAVAAGALLAGGVLSRPASHSLHRERIAPLPAVRRSSRRPNTKSDPTANR